MSGTCTPHARMHASRAHASHSAKLPGRVPLPPASTTHGRCSLVLLSSRTWHPHHGHRPAWPPRAACGGYRIPTAPVHTIRGVAWMATPNALVHHLHLHLHLVVRAPAPPPPPHPAWAQEPGAHFKLPRTDAAPWAQRANEEARHPVRSAHTRLLHSATYSSYILLLPVHRYAMPYTGGPRTPAALRAACRPGPPPPLLCAAGRPRGSVTRDVFSWLLRFCCFKRGPCPASSAGR